MIANIATVSRAKKVHNQNTALQCKWNKNRLIFKNVNAIPLPLSSSMRIGR